MNEYEKLKRAMNDYTERNKELLEQALLEHNIEEIEKRNRRVYAIQCCKNIMEKAK